MKRKIELANSAGFCFGVKRAVDLVYDESEKNEKTVTLGPIIHNEEVVKDLSSKGVQVVERPEDINDGTVIIRSHGIEKAIYDKLEKQDLRIVDATCPFVKKIHRTVEAYSTEGRTIVVIGSPKHPEVKGIVGWSKNSAVIIETKQEAENFVAKHTEKLCIVAQTTFNYKKFKELVEIISKKGYDIIAVNTICNATEERQTEARAIAKRVEAMIVIGGKNSSNSQKLYEICKNECENTFFIQTVNDLDVEALESFESLGITAGASTPNNIIQEVLLACQK